MDPIWHIEPVKEKRNDEWRIGVASWDEMRKGGAGKQVGLKYAWPDSRGRASRGGEVPIAAVAQGVEFAVATGHLEVADVLEAVARGVRRRQQNAEDRAGESIPSNSSGQW